MKNIRCFSDVSVPLGPSITVIIGGNGAGKTTLVEALASMTWGDGEGLDEFPLRGGAKSGEISLWSGGKAVAKWGKSSRKRLPAKRLLLAYGRYRRVFFPDADEPSMSSGTAALESLSFRQPGSRTATLSRPDNHLLRDLSKYLLALHAGAQFDPKKQIIWDRMNEALRGLGQSIEEVRMVDGPRGDVPMVVRRGTELGLRELSDGYQALLVIVFDMLLLYSEFFQKLDNPLEGEACVAIDEVDLHLHPRWQRTVVQQLLTLFPKTQFLLTTHSPAVVQGAIDLKQALVVLREAEDGSSVLEKVSESLLRRLRGAEIGSLLVEGRLFGVDSRYSTKINEKEADVAALREQVEAGNASEVEVKKLARHAGDLHRLIRKEDARRSVSTVLSELADIADSFVDDLANELATEKRGTK